MKTPDLKTCPFCGGNDGRKQSKRGMGWCEKYLRYLAAGKTKISGPALEHCADYINSANDWIQQLETSYGQVSKALCGKENATLEELLQEVSQVKSRLAQAERERDAAIADLKLYAGCKVCKHGDFKFPHECMDCGYDNNNWQWRGVCPENTKEE